MEGWIKLHRKLLSWEWYQDSHTLHLFLHLLLQANHQPTRWRGQVIEQGQVLTGRHLLSKQTGLSEQSIRTSLERLKSTSEITSQPTNRFSIITLVKYKEYQINDKKSTNAPNNHLTNNQPAINQQSTTSKNDKNEKKEKKDLSGLPDRTDIVNEIINFLNTTAKREYKTSTPKTRALILARIKEGFTLEDFKKVINLKTAEWLKDAERSMYLRPETLFGTKFESYLNTPPPQNDWRNNPKGVKP